MTWQQLRPHTAVLAAGYALAVAAASGLLGPYRTYGGQPLAEQLIVLFLLPVTATVIVSLIVSLHRRRLPDQSNGSADAALRGIVLWVVIFLMGVHTVLVAVLTNTHWLEPWASRCVVALVGITVIAVGNLLPRTRPNMALGIRTARTLADRHLWILTHRVSGYIGVALGLVIVGAAIFSRGHDVAAISGIAFFVSLGLVAAIYWKAARQVNVHRV